MSQMLTEMKPTAADPQHSVFVPMPAVVRMTGLGRSTIYRLMVKTSSRPRYALPNVLSPGAASILPSGAPRARRFHTDPSSGANGRAAPLSGYIAIASFMTAPISSIAASTLPQRQVVNQ